MEEKSLLELKIKLTKKGLEIREHHNKILETEKTTDIISEFSDKILEILLSKV